MTVSTVTPRNEYVGNGVQTTFTYTFRIFDAEDLEVYVDDELQTYLTDYTISGVDVLTGGTVVFDTAPANNARVTFVRNILAERTTDYDQSGDFKADTVDRDFDRLWEKAKELIDQYSRTVRLSASDSSAVLALPAEADRANRVLAFDSDGDVNVSTLTLSELEGQVNIAAAQAIAAAASASSANSSKLAAQAAQSATEAAKAAAEAAQAAAEQARDDAIAAAYESVTLSITAAGTDQSGATALTAELNEVTTTSSGAGVRLPTPSEGEHVIVFNRGANALLIYPASGGIIDSLSTDAPFSLPAGTDITFFAASPTLWLSHISVARYS